jgi:hypothetical protein
MFVPNFSTRINGASNYDQYDGFMTYSSGIETSCSIDTMQKMQIFLKISSGT